MSFSLLLSLSVSFSLFLSLSVSLSLFLSFARAAKLYAGKHVYAAALECACLGSTRAFFSPLIA